MAEENKLNELLNKYISLTLKTAGKRAKKQLKKIPEYYKKIYKGLPKDIVSEEELSRALPLFKSMRRETEEADIRSGYRKGYTPATKVEKLLLETIPEATWKGIAEPGWDILKAMAGAAGGLGASVVEGIKQAPQTIKEIYQTLDIALTHPKVKENIRNLLKEIRLKRKQIPAIRKLKERQKYIDKLKRYIQERRQRLGGKE